MLLHTFTLKTGCYKCKQHLITPKIKKNNLLVFNLQCAKKECEKKTNRFQMKKLA